MRYLISFSLFFLFNINHGISQSLLKLKFVDNIYNTPIDSLELEIDEESYFTDLDGILSYEYKSLPIIVKINDYRFYNRNIEILNLNDNEYKLINRGIILDDIIVNSELITNKLKDISVSTSVVNDIELKKGRAQGYSFQIEMNFRSWRLGARIKEEPIIFVDRTIGESKMSKSIMYEAIWMVWRLRIWKIFGWI